MKWPKLLTNMFKKKKPGKVYPPGPVNRGRFANITIPPKPDPNLKKRHKLSRRLKLYVVRMIAQDFTNREILDAVEAESGIKLWDHAITTYRISPRWKHIIAKEKEKYLAALSDVPGYHERVRLERADKIYKYAIEHDRPDLALRATAEQRHERKSELSAPAVSLVFQQYNNLSEEELTERYNQALGKIEKSKRKIIKIEGGSDGVRGVEGEAGK